MEKRSTLIIGIPIDAALKKERTGVEEYTFQLVSHFLKIAREDSRYKFILYSSFPQEKVREIFPNAEFIASYPYQHFWFQRLLPKLIADTKPDIFFSPSSSLPKNFAGMDIPGVVTIHGMEWYNFPEHYSFAERLQLRLQTKNALEHARGIIAVSAHTRDGIENFFGKKTPAISIIHHGVELPARMPRRSPKTSWRILFVDRKDKRKNLKGMIEALNLVRRLAPDAPLIFSAVGPLGNDPSAKKHGDIKNVFVPEEEKIKHFKEADIFLFPSHDEGFGMPILEAQAHGVPVVCSSFLKEVAGEGALYCEPNDSQTIASALLTLMLHPAVYEEKRKAARANAKRFSWEKCAKKTLEFLEKVCE